MTRTERGAIAALYAGLGLTVLATVVPYTTHLPADHVAKARKAVPGARVGHSPVAVLATPGTAVAVGRRSAVHERTVR
ncbi:hypothetical protein OG439_28050 [Amycolatopsis sp. NBC_01307]|uniref:hypothetical protein n=1 Tax=Amycolatopsis sp. NBC_01307 TaxID=2903561 RepID=UPI002E14A492|nr:hypothetical protein OG439_28050 [Amycolatopsis sp. NBC_01307]